MSIMYLFIFNIYIFVLLFLLAFGLKKNDLSFNEYFKMYYGTVHILFCDYLIIYKYIFILYV